MIPGTPGGLELLAYLGMPGGMELIVVLLIVLLLFGKRLPSAMRNLGSSIVEFKKGAKEGEESITEEPHTDEDDSSKAPA